jgi:hypothetical protein
MCIQNGYGFVHFALTNEGIKSAFHAVEALHQVTINQISYDCSVSNQLRQVLAQMDRDPSMKQQILNQTANNRQLHGNYNSVSPPVRHDPFAGRVTNGYIDNASGFREQAPPRSPFSDCTSSGVGFGMSRQQMHHGRPTFSSTPPLSLSSNIPLSGGSMYPTVANPSHGSYVSSLNSGKGSVQSFNSQATTPPTPNSMSSFNSHYWRSENHSFAASEASSRELSFMNSSSAGSSALAVSSNDMSFASSIASSFVLDSRSLLMPNPGRFMASLGSDHISENSIDCRDAVFNREFGEFVPGHSTSSLSQQSVSALLSATTPTLQTTSTNDWGSSTLPTASDLKTATFESGKGTQPELSVDEQLEALWFDC